MKVYLVIRDDFEGQTSGSFKPNSVVQKVMASVEEAWDEADRLSLEQGRDLSESDFRVEEHEVC